MIDQENDQNILETEKALFINNFFSNIGPNLAKNFSERLQYGGLTTETNLEHITTNNQEIIAICKDIDITKAACVYHLSSTILKDAFLA